MKKKIQWTVVSSLVLATSALGTGCDNNCPYSGGGWSGSCQDDPGLSFAEKQVDLTDPQTLSEKYQINPEGAQAIATLAQQKRWLENAGPLQEEDQEVLTRDALRAMGVTQDELNEAMNTMLRDGNKTAVNALIEKAARHLGMPSSDALRKEILPAFGVTID